MNFVVRAVPRDAFAQWVATARQSGQALDRTSYVALSQQSKGVRPFTYGTIDPTLFNAVATQQLPPGPGPSAGGGGAGAHPRAGH
jgi:cytochrome o ubiquinol oxidase subunit II